MKTAIPWKLTWRGCGGLNFFSGSLFPALTPQIDDGQPWSVDVALLDETLPTGDVHWKFTVRVLTPNWPLEVGDDVFDGTEDYDAIMQRYKDAYSQKKIRALDGADLVEYCCAAASGNGGRIYVDVHALVGAAGGLRCV